MDTQAEWKEEGREEEEEEEEELRGRSSKLDKERGLKRQSRFGFFFLYFCLEIRK